jgi:hypothetical protein
MPHKMMKLFLFRKVKFVPQVVRRWQLCEAADENLGNGSWFEVFVQWLTSLGVLGSVLTQECLLEKLG